MTAYGENFSLQDSPWVQAQGNLRLIAALLISFGLGFLFIGWAGTFVVLAAVITGLAMVAVAHRHFNGVTGDVFGATNELARMVCVIVLLAVAVWV